jgi:hypothetical protein
MDYPDFHQVRTDFTERDFSPNRIDTLETKHVSCVIIYKLLYEENFTVER